MFEQRQTERSLFEHFRFYLENEKEKSLAEKVLDVETALGDIT